MTKINDSIVNVSHATGTTVNGIVIGTIPRQLTSYEWTKLSVSDLIDSGCRCTTISNGTPVVIDSTKSTSASVLVKNAELIEYITDLSDSNLSTKISTTEKGASSGVCPLDANSKIPIEYAPTELLGAMKYKGAWDATSDTLTGTPGLAKGYYWVVSVSGSTSMSGINEWAAKDWIVYNGTGWDKIDNTEKALQQGFNTTTTGTVNWDITAYDRFELSNALTGTIQVNITNPVSPSIKYFTFKQGASSFGITFARGGVTFRSDHSSTTQADSYSIAGSNFYANAWYTIQFNWLSNTLCQITLLQSNDANKANTNAPVFTGGVSVSSGGGLITGNLIVTSGTIKTDGADGIVANDFNTGALKVNQGGMSVKKDSQFGANVAVTGNVTSAGATLPAHLISKGEVDTALALKADTINVYDKATIDAAFGNHYNKAAIDSSFSVSNASIATKQTKDVQGTSATSTGAIAWDLATAQRLLINSALTGAITLNVTNPQAPITNILNFQQGATLRTVTITLTGVNFRFGSAGAQVANTIAISAGDFYANMYYSIHLNWITTTLCHVDLIGRSDSIKANLASPAFTGTPTLPTGSIGTTQALGTSGTSLATTAFVQSAMGYTLSFAVATTPTTAQAVAPIYKFTGASGFTMTMTNCVGRGYLVINQTPGTIVFTTGTGATQVSLLTGKTMYIFVLDANNVLAETSNFSDIAGKPTTLSGYGITDARTSAQEDAIFLKYGDSATAIGTADAAIDSFLTRGQYFVVNSTSTPGAGWYYLEVYPHNNPSSFCRQDITELEGTLGKARKFYRTKYSNIWQPWIEIITSNGGVITAGKDIKFGTEAGGDYIGQYYDTASDELKLYNGTGGANLAILGRTTGNLLLSGSMSTVGTSWTMGPVAWAQRNAMQYNYTTKDILEFRAPGSVANPYVMSIDSTGGFNWNGGGFFGGGLTVNLGSSFINPDNTLNAGAQHHVFKRGNGTGSFWNFKTLSNGANGVSNFLFNHSVTGDVFTLGGDGNTSFLGTVQATGIKTASGTGTKVFADNGTLVDLTSLSNNMFSNALIGDVSLTNTTTETAVMTFNIPANMLDYTKSCIAKVRMFFKNTATNTLTVRIRSNNISGSVLRSIQIKRVAASNDLMDVVFKMSTSSVGAASNLYIASMVDSINVNNTDVVQGTELFSTVNTTALSTYCVTMQWTTALTTSDAQRNMCTAWREY